MKYPSQINHSIRSHILLCVSGGIAAFKAVLLLRSLQRWGYTVRVAMTQNATKFIGPATFEALTGQPVALGLWSGGERGGEPHIDLSEWADVVLVVPATASLIARMANGIADDVVSAALLAANGPLIVAPAMHSRMYLHPATQENLQRLRSRGVIIVDAVEGDLAVGHGIGRLAEPDDILEEVIRASGPMDLANEPILVTAGPTREPIDPVRFISNHSTGKMGFHLATAAWRRGAKVTLVHGPTSLKSTFGVSGISISTGEEMYEAVMSEIGRVSGVIMAAAIGDYRSSLVADEKIKKDAPTLHLELEKTRDILQELGRMRLQQHAGSLEKPENLPVLVGFAMETTDLEAHALAKLHRKGCDIMVANNLREAGAGFGHDTNRVTIFEREGTVTRLPILSKMDVAHQILDRVKARIIKARGELQP